jgi:hypothetical protein
MPYLAVDRQHEQVSQFVPFSPLHTYSFSHIYPPTDTPFRAHSLTHGLKFVHSLSPSSNSGYQGIVPLFTNAADAASKLGGTPGGVLLDTTRWIDKAFRCGYTSDGGTMTRWNKGCGCNKVNHKTNLKVPQTCTNWCSDWGKAHDPLKENDPKHPWLCAWKTTELDQLLQVGGNTCMAPCTMRLVVLAHSCSVGPFL